MPGCRDIIDAEFCCACCSMEMEYCVLCVYMILAIFGAIMGHSVAGCTNVTRNMYPNMAHSTCLQEMQDLQKFLDATIPEVDDTPAPSL